MSYAASSSYPQNCVQINLVFWRAVLKDDLELISNLWATSKSYNNIGVPYKTLTIQPTKKSDVQKYFLIYGTRFDN